jgi:hypothetical protein
MAHSNPRDLTFDDMTLYHFTNAVTRALFSQELRIQDGDVKADLDT